VRLDEAGVLWLSGPVEEVCRGTLSPDLVARLAAVEG
jgi:hypothetical protein